MMAKHDPLVGFDKIPSVVMDFAGCSPAIIQSQDASCDPFRIKPIANGITAKRGDQNVRGIDRLPSAPSQHRISPCANQRQCKPKEVKANFFQSGGIRLRTAATIAVTPVLIVGSGTGAQNGECNEGSGLSVRSASLKISLSTPPTVNIQIGILGATRPNSEKSSPPMLGFFWMTLVSPN